MEATMFGIHICPIEVSAFLMFYRDIVVVHGGPLVRWFIGCCADCCSHTHTKKELWRNPMMFEARDKAWISGDCNAKYHVDVDHDHCQRSP